jgi:PHD/YefM family antitoxin component YafN of YafNO toxin-antitoxin module
MINTVSITDLKQNTASVIKNIKTSGKSAAILQRSEIAAVLVDPVYYETLEQALEDLEDLRDIELRKNEPTVPMEEVLRKIAAKK